MSVKLGTLDISAFKVGSADCKVYLGETLIYSGDTPTPPTPTPSYSGQYLTFIATESGTFKFSGNSIDYSLDSGNTWTTLASDTDSPTVNAGSKIMWLSTLSPLQSLPYGIGKFASSGNFTVEGNPMSLLYGDNFIGVTDLTGKDYAFRNLFSDCTGMTSAENLSLPATTLANSCYFGMFNSCTSLTTAPELPATTLAEKCYQGMFSSCMSLTTAPSLPATTLADSCYRSMFSSCASLETAPVINATTLSSYCCYAMFNGCLSLTTAQELLATTLTDYCYERMFYGCISLETAPVINATTIPTETSGSCRNMFFNCSSLTTAPVLSATTLASFSYRYMFKGCTSLSSITCLATDISAKNCTNGWVQGVAASGTFTKATSMTSWTTGNNGIPSGWTVQDATPPLAFGVYDVNGDILTSGTCESLSNGTLTIVEISNNYTVTYDLMYSAVVGDCVTTIDQGAFNAAVLLGTPSFTSITIGSGVTTIGQGAFAVCRGLTSITINATTPPTLGSDVFLDTNDCPIYVPSASVNAYQSDSGWSTVASRIQAIPNS